MQVVPREEHAEALSPAPRAAPAGTGPFDDGADNFREEREELERVLRSPGISRSTNLVRFLTFICAKYFDGEAEEIRERTVAVEALGRKEAGFDSHADPIVRVTARELRKKLLAFYENEGRTNPLHLVLPLGGYVPQFIRPPVGAAAPPFGEPALIPSEPAGHQTPSASAGLRAWPATREFLAQVRWSSVLKTSAAVLGIAAIFAAGFLAGRRKDIETASAGPTSLNWGDPVWSEDFDGPAHQLPDSSRWTYDTGNADGWGNHELETYCSPRGPNPKECDPRHPNAFLDGAGHLVLLAQKNAEGQWTSARITTRGLKTFQYGRIEARMKLPVGVGLWPSFWMLGANFPTAGWPASGSVGILENVSQGPNNDGLGPTVVRSTLHGPRYAGGNGLWHDFKLPNGERVDDGSFHTYGVIWSPGMMQFYVDDPANIFFVQHVGDLPQGGAWVFDQPFFLIFNLAVGGDWPGAPNDTTPNPAEVLVDYVRAYQIPTVPAPALQWEPVQVQAGSAAASIIKLRAPSSVGHVYLSCSTVPSTVVCSLATSVVDFSGSPSQEDSLTISTNSFTEKGRIVAQPGNYKLSITATTMSGNHSQITVPFEVTGSK